MNAGAQRGQRHGIVLELHTVPDSCVPPDACARNQTLEAQQTLSNTSPTTPSTFTYLLVFYTLVFKKDV